MKKFLAFVVVFFVVVSAVDFVFGKACDYMTLHARGGVTKQLLDLCDKDSYDILIMGSSKAHHNYIPQMFIDSLGLSCYNAGYDGNGIILAYGILSMIEDDRLPKVLLYDVKQQFDIYHYNGDGDYTRYFQKLKKFIGNPVISEIIGDISKVDVVKLKSGLVRYNSELLFTLSGFLKNGDKDHLLGYNPISGQLTQCPLPEKDYTDEIDSLKMDYFRKFVTLTKEKGIALIIVFSPEYNTPYSADFQPVRDLCEAEGIHVLDLFADSTFQNIGCFADHCHLNEQGSVRFTEEIIRVLRTNKVLQ